MIVKPKEILIKAIYLCLMLFIVVKMMAGYTFLEVFNKISLLILLAIIVLDFLFKIFNLQLQSKVKISIARVFVYIFLIYQIFIALRRYSLYFPTAHVNIIAWPLTFLVFWEYTSKNKLPKFIENSTKFFMWIFMGLSCLLVEKHLSGEGNAGQAIFPTYFCLSLMPFILMNIQNKKLKWLFITLCTIILIASTKRAGTIAAIIGIFAYMFTDAYIQGNLKEKRKKYFKYIAIVLLICCIGLIIIKYSDIKIMDRIMSISDDGGSGRDLLWEEVLYYYEISADNEKMLGHGFQSVYYKIQPLGYYRLAHNSYIEYLYDYGYIGLTMLLIFFGSLIIKTLTMLKKKDQNASYMFFSIIIAIILSCFSYFFEQSVIIMPIAILWGCCIGEQKRKQLI